MTNLIYLVPFYFILELLSIFVVIKNMSKIKYIILHAKIFVYQPDSVLFIIFLSCLVKIKSFDKIDKI